MKILIYHWNSYNQKDVEEAFVKTGNYITILERKTENIEEDMAYVYTVTDMLEQQKPDIFFQFLHRHAMKLAFPMSAGIVTALFLQCTTMLYFIIQILYLHLTVPTMKSLKTLV